MNFVFSTVLFNTPLDSIYKLLDSIESYYSFLLSQDPCPGQISLFVHDNSFMPLKIDIVNYTFSITYFHSVSNLGYGLGHNSNFNAYEGSSKALFIVCNPDVSFSAKTIAPFFSYLVDNPSVACAAPLIRLPDGSLQYSAKKDPTFISLLLGRFSWLCVLPFASRYLYHNQRRDFDYHSIFSSSYLSGCFLAFPFSFYSLIGGFSDNYFLHFEDADVVRRASRVGLAIHCPVGEICHGRGRGSHKSLFQQFHLICSAFKYFRSWGFRLI